MPHRMGAGREHPQTHLIHIICIIGFIGVCFSDSVILNFSTFLINFISPIVRFILFVIFLVIALLFFKLSGNAVFPHDQEEKPLAKTGIFAHVRNPMYLGTPLIFIAFIFLTLSLISIVPLIITMVLFNNMVKFEEKDLEKIFGQEYLEYKKKVPRWLPRLTPAKFED